MYFYCVISKVERRIMFLSYGYNFVAHLLTLQYLVDHSLEIICMYKNHYTFCFNKSGGGDVRSLCHPFHFMVGPAGIQFNIDSVQDSVTKIKF